MTDEPEVAPHRPALVGMVPVRLAVGAGLRQLPSAITDEAHDLVRDQALEWQGLSGSATIWEMAAQEADEGAAYALAGQMASAGEQLALAYSAAVEVALWQETTEQGDAEVARQMSMRAMAEAQSLFVIGTGHAVANVALRALALRHDLRLRLIEAFRVKNATPVFDPFSSSKPDWVSMNDVTCMKLREVARHGNLREVIALVEPVASYGLGSTWRALVDRRGEDFHRWRPQTHGMQGVPRKSPWRHEGMGRVLGIGSPIYDEARDLAGETARLADDAMLGLARSMMAFVEGWIAARSALGGPDYPESAVEH